jgi:hemoglobin-like flavoprotein
MAAARLDTRIPAPFECRPFIRMTPAQLRLLQQSFTQIEPLAEQFGAMFYERLFEIAPDIEPMLRADPAARHSKFMTVIGEVMQLHLRAMISLPATAQAAGEVTLPGAFSSGKLHVAQGVRMADFEKMKEALIWVLEQALGADMTPEVRDAWLTAYDIVVRAMQSGMKSGEGEEPEPGSDAQQRPDPADEEEGAATLLKMLGER